MFGILNKYLMKEFFVKLFIVYTIFLGFGILIEFITKVGKFEAFSFFLNFEKALSFIFFINTTWFLLSLQKSRELISILTSGISTFKIISLVSFCIFIFSIFYILIYDGILLKKLSNNHKGDLFLSEFELYHKESTCNFDLIFFDEIYYSKDKFYFNQADVVSFQDCKMKSHINFVTGELNENQNTITIQDAVNTFSLGYNFDILKASFENKMQTKSFKTIINKIELMLTFIKHNIQSGSLGIDIIDFFQVIISFFYMALLSFVFFIKIPPRSEILFKIFFSFLAMAVLYILNMILTNYIKQISIINPILILVFGFIVIAIEIIMLIAKKV